MAWALGAESLDELSRRMEKFLQLELPRGVAGHLQRLGDLLRIVKARPVLVGDPPCQEVVETRNPTLAEVPVLQCWPGDAGPYITLPLVITRDPVTGRRNVGMYRLQVFDERTLGVHWQRHKGGREHEDAARGAGQERLEVAVALGGDPATIYAATAPLPSGVDELLFAGWLRGEGVELARCLTVDLEVPAHAEIVIEGEVLPDKIAPDGPFGEYPGYRSGTMASGIAVKVKAITYRHNPILTMIALGTPPDDSSIAASLTAAVAMKKGLMRHGVPVVDVYVPPEGVTHLIVVGVKRGGEEVARKVLDYFTLRRVMTNKHIVVDEDVDVFNMAEVLHAFATRCHPGKGIFLEHYEGRANSLTPFYSPEERSRLKGVSVVFDSTWPPAWPEEIVPIKASFKTIYSPEVQEKVEKNWESYGINLGR